MIIRLITSPETLGAGRFEADFGPTLTFNAQGPVSRLPAGFSVDGNGA